jgi:hypothetical protein
MAVQGITANDQRQLRGLITQTRPEALGRFALTGLLLLAVVVAPLFGLYGHHPMRARFDQSARDHGMTKRHLPRTVLTLQTTGALQAGGRKIVATVEHQGLVSAVVCTA